MRGRKPKPTEIKKLEGNPGHRALNDDEPELPPGAGDPPPELDEGARAEWLRLSAILTAARVLTMGDRGILTLYCVAWSRWVDAEKKLAQFGAMLKSAEGGTPYLNPYLSVSRRAADQVAKFGAMLGLDPSSRSRIHVEKAATAKVATRPKTKLDQQGPPKKGK